MRFDIDYAHAKTMATRLQDFLSQNPTQKLSRSSSIEAVARMLGFNNRNEMKARTTSEVGEPQAALEETNLDHLDPRALQQAASAMLAKFLATERHACAANIVRTARGIDPDASFVDAIHADDPYEHIHTLLLVEDDILDKMDRDPGYKDLLFGALASSEEYEAAFEEFGSVARAMARALTNEAYSLAEALWDAPSESEEDKSTWASAFEGAARAVEKVIREEGDFEQAILRHADALAARFGKSRDGIISAIRDAFAAWLHMSPEEYDEKTAQRPWHAWDVDVSCWIPGRREIEIEDGTVHILEAEIMHMATIQVDASDERHAFARARVRLGTEDFSMIWNPRPDRGVRKLRGEDEDGRPLKYDLVQAYAGETDDFDFDLTRITDLRPDQIVT